MHNLIALPTLVGPPLLMVIQVAMGGVSLLNVCCIWKELLASPIARQLMMVVLFMQVKSMCILAVPKYLMETELEILEEHCMHTDLSLIFLGTTHLLPTWQDLGVGLYMHRKLI